MLPSKIEAEEELDLAGDLNSGPWIRHSYNVGIAAKCIAQYCSDLDEGKAYILGILHDIGKRNGFVSTFKHVYEGYHYCMDKGWDEAARICMTHTYVLKEQEFGMNITKEEQEIKDYLKVCEYDDYDRLIMLCDSLAEENGFCMMEKRLVDVARRHGVNEFTVPRWNANFALKEYFEKKIGNSIYNVLPFVKETTFIEKQDRKTRK